ncbi:MAG: fibronectin type III domain-containing protein, partial [Bacteroidia bacterium]
MKTFLLAVFILLFFFSVSLNAQTCQDIAVELGAVAQTGPAQITLKWVANATTTQYDIYRKSPTATAWGPVLASLTGTATQYVDNTVSAGGSYEYRIIRTGSGYYGFGYINAGVNVPAIDYRGKVILLVDST